MAGQVDIPKMQRAAVKESTGRAARAVIKEIDVPQPGPGEILVKLSWTGLCASDKALLHDEWGTVGVSMQAGARGIAGHEGVGRVVAVGEKDNKNEGNGDWRVGDRAGIKWITDVCGRCHFCRQVYEGGEVLCQHQVNSGFTAAGTFQQYCVTSARYATRIPEGVADEEAGPIMCGGVTAYTACKRSRARPGDWAVMLGAGGGLGHLGVQYAKAMGIRVIAIDAGAAKRELCLQLGAEAFLDFSEHKDDLPARVAAMTNGLGAHAAIVFASARGGYAVAPSLLRSGGTVVAVGLPGDPSVLAGAPPLMLALKKLSIVGSVVGTLQDVDEALDFTARGLVHPTLTKGTLDDVNKFMEAMEKGNLVGRAVLKLTE